MVLALERYGLSMAQECISSRLLSSNKHGRNAGVQIILSDCRIGLIVFGIPEL